MLRWLNVSEAAAKIATSVTPARDARARVRRGSAPARCSARRDGGVMPANTSAASAICGTHFGLTNADDLDHRQAGGGQPIDERDLVRRSAIAAASFCRPSRGPTSTTVTRGRPHGCSSTSACPACTSSPSRQCTACDRAVGGRTHRQLHLHRFEHDQDVAALGPPGPAAPRSGGRWPASAPSAIPQRRRDPRRRPGCSTSNVNTRPFRKTHCVSPELTAYATVWPDPAHRALRSIRPAETASRHRPAAPRSGRRRSR